MDREGSDELARLAGSFNTMLEALERSMRQQRQLVADASHELRTPLTSLRTNVEVLAGADGMAPADRERLLRDVVAQLEELTVLVGDLVDLARDEDELPEPMTDVRLDELVAEVVESARRRHPERPFSLELEPALVRAAAPRLARAVANLVDNAEKWSPAGAQIEVTVSSEGELVVRDHGPGIAPEDAPYVFDRFYRAASARGTPGSGLGLAIVRHVAETHDGSVAAQAAPGGGARLVLRLPASEAAAASLSPPCLQSAAT
jgi:two-component system sensor histidine kinase MprB